MRVPPASSVKVTSVCTLKCSLPSEETPPSKASRSGGVTSVKVPRDQLSVPSGSCMQTAMAPPARKSMSASGTVQSAGLNQRLICAASLQARNKISRGTGKRRESSSVSGLVVVSAMLVSFLGLVEIGGQAVEAGFPFRAPRLQPVLHLVQPRRAELAAAHPPHFARAGEPGLLQHGEMLQHRRHGHLQRLRQLAHRGRAAREALQHGAASRVGEGLEGEVEGGGLVKHGLNYKGRE